MNRRIGVILSYVAMIFEILSTLIITPFIIRTLGNAEYGVYKLSASVVAYLLLLDLGVGNAVIRYVSKFRAVEDKAAESKFVGVSTIYYIAIALIVFLLGVGVVLLFPSIFATGLTNEECLLAQKLLFVSVINVGITLGTAGYANIIIAYERFAFSKGVSILSIVLKIVLTYILLSLGVGSLGVVLVQLGLTIATRACYVLYVFIQLRVKPIFKNIDFSFLKEIILYSSLILLQMIATQINTSVDQILLGMLVPMSAIIIGVYGIGLQIIQYFQSIGSAFTGVLMPGVVKMVEKGASPEELCQEMIRIGRIIFMILGIIWIAFLIFGEQFIILWAGGEYIDAFWVVIILMLPHLFILTESIGTQILWAQNKHKEQAILKFLIVLINIIFSVILIKWKPLIGATIGTFISLLLGDIAVMNYVFKKHIGISIKRYYKGLFKGIVPCLLISLLAGWVFSLLKLSGWIGWLINVSFIVLIYISTMLLFGMNSYEKGLSASIFKKIIKRR